MIAEVPVPLVRELRAMMRDYPEVNYLYSGKETQDNEYARILFQALEKFAHSPPVFTESWTFRNGFPQAVIPFLLDYAVGVTLREVSLWMMRNDFSWQSGNTSVRLYDRWRAYQSIYPQMMAEASNSLREWKASVNSERAWGASFTEMYDPRGLVEGRDWITVTV